MSPHRLVRCMPILQILGEVVFYLVNLDGQFLHRSGDTDMIMFVHGSVSRQDVVHDAAAPLQLLTPFVSLVQCSDCFFRGPCSM